MPRGLHRGLTRFALAVSVRDTLTGRVVVWPEGTAELRIETETGEQAATGVVEAGGDFQVPLPAPVPDTVELLLLSGLLTDTVSGPAVTKTVQPERTCQAAKQSEEEKTVAGKGGIKPAVSRFDNGLDGNRMTP